MERFRVGNWSILIKKYKHMSEPVAVIYHYCVYRGIADGFHKRTSWVLRIYKKLEEILDEQFIDCHVCGTRMPGIVYAQLCKYSLNELHKSTSIFHRIVRAIRDFIHYDD